MVCWRIRFPLICPLGVTPCIRSILLQTCRGQWGAVQEWVQEWISKTLRRWKFTSHKLVSWWLENIYIGLQVKEYLDNLGVEYRLAELLDRVSKFWPQVLQIWVLSWKRSGSLSPPWRLLGRDQEGLHQGFFSTVFGSESDDHIQALRIYTTNCDEYKHAHSCHKVIMLLLKSLQMKWLYWVESRPGPWSPASNCWSLVV